MKKLFHALDIVTDFIRDWWFPSALLIFLFVGSFLAIKNGAATSQNIIVIDGCEYIKTRSHGGCYTLTHKGNCRNH